jgi:tetratricopeptide (TPR) repeat protein
MIFLLLIGAVLLAEFPAHAQKRIIGSSARNESMDADYLFAFTRATKLYVFGDYGNALNLYRECLKYEPGSAALNYQISLIYTKGGDIDNARLFARKAYLKNVKNEWYARQYGRLCQASGLYDSAIIVYKGLLNGTTDDAGLNFILSGIMEKKGKNEEAIAYLNKIEKDLGVTQEVTVNKARIYSEHGQMKFALAELRRALAMNPEDYIIRGVMAEMFRDSNKADSADFYYRSIIKDHKDDANVVFSFAEFLLVQKKNEEAKALFMQALANDQIEPGVKLNYLYNAIRNNQMFVTLSPVLDTLIGFFYAENGEDVHAMALYADYYYRKGVYDKTIPVLKRIIKQNDGNYSAWEQLLFCYNGLGLSDSVLISGKLAIQLFPEEPMAFLLSASVLYGKKQYLPAIEILQRAVPISENSRVEGNILSLLAECYGRTGQYVMSDNMYENATKVDSTDVVVLNNYAYSLAERSVLLDKAESMSRKAIEGDPGNGTYLDTYGWVLFKQGRYVEAKKYIKQAIKLEGESNPEILSHMGDIYDKLNSNSKADKYWTKALFFAEEEMKIVLKEKLSKSKGR